MLYPKLFTTLRTYSRSEFVSDLIAGVIIGIVALPLAIAFAIASGVSPERGLITAVVAGFLISVLGGSRVQIGGPTGAFVVIVYAIVQKHGMDGLLVANLMAGVILIFMGIARFGGVIKFIPYPVTIGFTSGIALIVFSSQLKDFLGLQMGEVPADFMAKYAAYFKHIRSVNGYALAVSALCVLIIQGWKKVSRKIPGSLVALVVCTAVVQIFRLPVETIGSRFGEIPHMLPAPQFPKFSIELVRQMIPSATTIAILAGIESLLSAVIADGMIGGRHRSNMELIAQGIANIASPLFGGMPATGAIARTTTNIHNGGRTPVAGIIHALTLLSLMFFFGKWAVLIPLPCLAGILVVVAYHMSEWHSFFMVLRSPRSDVIVLLTTFGLTVLVDLTAAIQIGMVLAAFLFMRRMAVVTNIGMITRELKDEEEVDDPNAINKREVPEGVEVYEINGPFFFGASYKFLEAMKIVSGKQPKARVIRMRNVNAIDATGMHVIKEEFLNSRKKSIAFILSEIHAQPLIASDRSGLLELIGEENVFGNIDDALNRVREILGLPKMPRPTPFVPVVKREGLR
ncbi:MAG: STAS domain-containing protein [Candidatus Omnitrophica bacterium]|nr:STAS domain-containing protein [Candidatus Omnitrophota bacterium]